MVEYEVRFGCGCSAETISPGAGRAGSLSWRFMRTVLLRLAVVCGLLVDLCLVMDPTELPLNTCKYEFLK